MIQQTFSLWIEQRPAWLGVMMDVSAKATLLLGGALVVACALRKAPASARHLLWFMAIAGALVLAPLAVLLPEWRVQVLPAVEPHGALSPAASGSNWPSWETWVLAAWLAGGWVVLGKLLVARAKVRFFAKMATPVTDWRRQVLSERIAARPMHGTVQLLESADVDLPMTWGFRVPTIALPLESTGWSRARLEAALAHELAHVRRLDAFTQLVAQVACALYWFHPLVWLGAVQMRRLREFACDDEVLANGTKPSQYAQELLAIVRAAEEKKHLGLLTATMANPGQLKARLLAVLNPGVRRSRIDRARAAALALGTSGVVLVLAMIRPVSEASGADAQRPSVMDGNTTCHHVRPAAPAPVLTPMGGRCSHDAGQLRD
jgi:beta-lactamase regulating signal transducer with metallopeptidase domain